MTPRHEAGVVRLGSVRRFEDGSLSVEEGPANLVGVLGDEVLVNGTHDPHLTVHDRLVRLRLLNASNVRVYNSASPTTARSDPRGPPAA